MNQSQAQHGKNLIVCVGLPVSQICCSSDANSNLWQAKGRIEEQDAASNKEENHTGSRHPYVGIALMEYKHGHSTFFSSSRQILFFLGAKDGHHLAHFFLYVEFIGSICVHVTVW
jgi:hypothetical protein